MHYVQENCNRARRQRALGNTLYERLELIMKTAKPIVDLIAQGSEAIIASGFMLPKAQAAMGFAESKVGRVALIALH